MNPKVHLLEAIQLSEIEAVRAFFVEYEGTLPFDPGYQVFDDEISGVSGSLAEPCRAFYLAKFDGLPVGAKGLRGPAPHAAEFK